MHDDNALKHEPTTGGQWEPDRVYLETLRAALTPAAVEYAIDYARTLARFGATAHCDETPEELAREAMTDTALGLCRWDPARGPLGRFLAARVRHNVGHRAKQAARMVRIDYLEDDDQDAGEVDRALSAPAAAPARLVAAEVVTTAIVLLREACAADTVATIYLGARLAGADTLGEVGTATGLPAAVVAAAHRRVVRHARALPAPLRTELTRLLA